MNEFKILADSCCDISDEILKEIDVDTIPYYTCLDGKNHLKERVDISIDEFYNQLETNDNLFPKTSFPTIQEFSDFFCQYLKKNMDILFISMTSKFSSAFQAIINLTEDLKKEYPSLLSVYILSKETYHPFSLLISSAGICGISSLKVWVASGIHTEVRH